MSIEFFPYPFWVGVSLLLLILIIVAVKTRSSGRVILSAIFGFYLLILLGLTLFPIPSTAGHIGLPTRPLLKAVQERINLVPFSYGVLVDRNGLLLTYHILGNIAAAMPFGFGVLFVAPKLEKRILWLAIGLGSCIELLQLGFMIAFGYAYRSVDINDVMWNAVGVFVGYGIFKLTQSIFSKRRFSTNTAS